ncbi:hypothetical protein T265_08001 [Opisthorchis viverrini]|uniref:WD domain, G-beta repeat protein n=1 Tax=Opisthorchis viverrini TaxID=6198 RepID=A0A074ZAK2_OPIVI|nr:hypothetical protein T265_08001 [Opisthorchis viverrini]KER24316.1 hypothetical protein T265_08001 [Opisthorchis viverrini]
MTTYANEYRRSGFIQPYALLEIGRWLTCGVQCDIQGVGVDQWRSHRALKFQSTCKKTASFLSTPVTLMMIVAGEDSFVKPAYSQKLPADSNVFTAKFLPQTNGGQVLVGFKCGCVLRVFTDRPSESMIETVYCHSYAVYDFEVAQWLERGFTDRNVCGSNLTSASQLPLSTLGQPGSIPALVLPSDHPTCFITLSHDQSAVIFDTRQPVSVPTPCSQRCYFRDSSVSPPNPKGWHAGCLRMKFEFPVTAGDIHPLDGARRIALAFADGFVRVFDLRRLTQGISSIGDSVQPLPYQITRPLGLPAQVEERRCIRLDYGPGHITSVKFEPPFPRIYDGLFPASGVGSSVGFGARHLLVSHMYAPVFLFDLNKTESAEDVDPKTLDWLPHTHEDSESRSQESVNGEAASQGTRTSRSRDPEIRIALAFFHWLERRRSQRQSQVNEEHTADPQREEESSEDTEEPEPDTGLAPSDDDEASNTESRVSPFDILTKEYVYNVLQSANRCRQLKAYRGHRSCRTVIKDAVFWGRDHILSGSECGHVIAWNRHTGKPVRVIKADNAVVNRIAPHPTLPLFACSGIDHAVKLVEPNPQIYDTTEDLYEEYTRISRQHVSEATTLCEENAKYTIDSLQSGSLHLERLARLRTSQALRQILHRLMGPNRPST